jgi:nitrogen fixation NifU-like protein
MVTNEGLYSKKVMQHFRNPHNYGRIEKADAIGKVGNAVCGDVMYIYIKVKPVGKDTKQYKITDVKFETFGCVAAIATSSMITDLAKGKTIDAALKITKDNIAEKLGHLPQIKIHCSVLAIDALHEAIYQYFSANKFAISKQLEEEHKRIERAKTVGAFEHSG